MITVYPGSYFTIPFTGNDAPASHTGGAGDYSWEVRNQTGTVLSHHYAFGGGDDGTYFNGANGDGGPALTGPPFANAYLFALPAASGLPAQTMEICVWDGTQGHSASFNFTPTAPTAPRNLSVAVVS